MPALTPRVTVHDTTLDEMVQSPLFEQTYHAVLQTALEKFPGDVEVGMALVLPEEGKVNEENLEIESDAIVMWMTEKRGENESSFVLFAGRPGVYDSVHYRSHDGKALLVMGSKMVIKAGASPPDPAHGI